MFAQLAAIFAGRPKKDKTAGAGFQTVNMEQSPLRNIAVMSCARRSRLSDRPPSLTKGALNSADLIVKTRHSFNRPITTASGPKADLCRLLSQRLS